MRLNRCAFRHPLALSLSASAELERYRSVSSVPAYGTAHDMNSHEYSCSTVGAGANRTVTRKAKPAGKSIQRVNSSCIFMQFHAYSVSEGGLEPPYRWYITESVIHHKSKLTRRRSARRRIPQA